MSRRGARAGGGPAEGALIGNDEADQGREGYKKSGSQGETKSARVTVGIVKLLHNKCMPHARRIGVEPNNLAAQINPAGICTYIHR